MGLDNAKEIIRAERETCKFYLKMDFGFLAGAFSIFTILKLERVDIFKTIVGSKLFTTGIIALICYGLIFDYWLLIKWSLRDLTENQQKSVLKWSRVGIKIQLILHILLIGQVFFLL
ncbi:hypothetical protein KKA86_06610 [bacterium]|nr:hypothetical protein [bacterium]